MAKKITVTESNSNPRNYMARGNYPCKYSRDYPTDVVERPARGLGKILASDMADGVKLNSGSLLHGQHDEKFGVVDPASDIHTDKHLLADALLRRDIKSSKVNASGSDSLKIEDDTE